MVEQLNRPSTSPVFIVGTPRSGTTLTARILGRHTRLFMPGETHYFDDVYSRAREFADLGSPLARQAIAQRLYTIYSRYYELPDQERIDRLFPDISNLYEALDECRDYGSVLGQFMELQMQAEGKSRWGNNAPRDLFSIREIREFFPDAKLVICVRDIRAFLYSYKGKWRVTSDAGEHQVIRLRKLYHPVVTSYLWKSSMQQLPIIEDLVPTGDRIIVRYEDLVTDPEGTVRNLCATIEVDYEPDMLVVDSHNSSSAVDTRGIFASSVDLWKSALSQEEIAISQNIAGSLLNRLGYDAVPVHANHAKLLGLWLSTPYALLRALHANKGTRGPLIPYLFKRIGTLLGVSS